MIAGKKKGNIKLNCIWFESNLKKKKNKLKQYCTICIVLSEKWQDVQVPLNLVPKSQNYIKFRIYGYFHQKGESCLLSQITFSNIPVLVGHMFQVVRCPVKSYGCSSVVRKMTDVSPLKTLTLFYFVLTLCTDNENDIVVPFSQWI